MNAQSAGPVILTRLLSSVELQKGAVIVFQKPYQFRPLMTLREGYWSVRLRH